MAKTYQTIEYILLNGKPVFDEETDAHDTEPLFLDVTFTGSPEWANDGISSYEYWGCKGYDKGVDYTTMENSQVEWIKKDYTPEENEIIAAWLDKKANYESVENSLCNAYESECNNYENF